MALNSEQLKSMIIANLRSHGFIPTGSAHSKAYVMADAIAQAVVTHIQANAEVNVTGGSSVGVYKVK